MKKYDVTKIVDTDKNDIIQLHEQYLNYGPGVEKYINGIFSRKSYLGYKATVDGEIVGIALLEDGAVFTVPHKTLETRVVKDAGAAEIYSLASYIVKREHSGNHIGSLLLKKCVDDLKGSGSHKLLVEMWVYPNKATPAVGIKTQLPSYIDYGYIENFYKNQHLYHLFCPLCGKKCVCGAEVVMFDIN